MSGIASSAREPLLIELGGDIDLVNAEALGDALCEAIDRTSSGLLVDISAVPFMDSQAIAMMIRVHQRAREQDVGVTWRGMQPFPSRVVETMGLEEFLTFEGNSR